MTDRYRIAYKGEQAQLYLAKTNPAGWTWVDAPDMAHRFDCWECRLAMDIALDVLVTNRLMISLTFERVPDND